jgi:hypothetical protein
LTLREPTNSLAPLHVSPRLRTLRISARPRFARGRLLADTELCGARVQVLEGAFAGKTGVVQELDGKGSARVLFGQLSAYVEIVALALEKRATRAGLGSSHRRTRLAR